jgi:hypothetical protein
MEHLRPDTGPGAFLMPQSAADDYKNVTVPLLEGLKETGYLEGPECGG